MLLFQITICRPQKPLPFLSVDVTACTYMYFVCILQCSNTAASVRAIWLLRWTSAPPIISARQSCSSIEPMTLSRTATLATSSGHAGNYSRSLEKHRVPSKSKDETRMLALTLSKYDMCPNCTGDYYIYQSLWYSSYCTHQYYGILLWEYISEVSPSFPLITCDVLVSFMLFLPGKALFLWPRNSEIMH